MRCLLVACLIILPSFFSQVIDPDKSSVELMGSKVDLKLRKADLFSWTSLKFRDAAETKDTKQVSS